MESSDYPHSIVKEIQTRKQTKQQIKREKIKQEIFDVYYKHYKKIRFRYYGWVNLLDESEKKHIICAVESGVQKEFKEQILPNIKEQKLLYSGIPAVGLGVGSVVAGIMSEAQNLIPYDLSAGLVYAGASAVFLGAALGVLKKENTATMKNELYQNFLTKKTQKTQEKLFEKCEIRYQQDLIYGNIKKSSPQKKKNFNNNYGNANEK